MKKKCLNRKFWVLCTILLVTNLFIMHACAYADTLVLKNGQSIDGTFISSIKGIITFQVGDKVHDYSIAEVLSITFSQSAMEITPTPDVFAKPAEQNRWGFPYRDARQ